MKDQTKYKHWTNGVKNVFCEQCPDGWWNGITNNYTDEQRKKRSENHSKAVKGKKFYNNGIKNILVFPDSDIPEGFHEGFLSTNESKPKKRSKSLNFINSLSESEKILFEDRYRKNSDSLCANYYNVSIAVIKSSAKHLNIIRTAQENRIIKEQTELLKRKKTEETCLKKYGTKSPAESKSIKDKIKKSSLEKHGVITSGRGVE